MNLSPLTQLSFAVSWLLASTVVVTKKNALHLIFYSVVAAQNSRVYLMLNLKETLLDPCLTNKSSDTLQQSYIPAYTHIASSAL